MSTVLHPFIGADIEMFVCKKYVKTHKVIGATSVLKEKTYKDKGKITKDGILLEINPVPQTCRDNIRNDFKAIALDLKKIEKESKVVIKLEDIKNIHKAVFDKIHHKDKEMGCLPDINVYTGEPNDIPNHYQTIPTRTCGGHLHFGVPSLKVYIENCNNNQPLHPSTRSLFGNKKISLRKRLYSDEAIESFDGWDDPRPTIDTNIDIEQWDLHKTTFNRWLNMTYDKLLLLGLSKPDGRLPSVDFDKEKFKVKIMQDDYGVCNALKKPIDTVKFIDLFTAIPAVLLDPGKKGKDRRNIYGKAGSFRYTPYGFEYRTLSNFILVDSAIFTLLSGLARLAINMNGGRILNNNTYLCKAGKKVKRWINKNTEKLQYAINENDFNTAKHIYDDIIEPILSEYAWDDSQHIPLSNPKQREHFKRICMSPNGYKDFFKPENFLDNWIKALHGGWYTWTENYARVINYSEINTKWETYTK
jgi:hypothetical protein